MKVTKNKTLLAIFGALLLAGIVYGFLPGPIPVDLATVTRGPLQVTVNADGKTRIKERYVVSTPLSGRISRIDLRAGDAVEAGMTLITSIEPADPDLLDPRARAQAEARVKAARTARMQAAPLLERARTAHGFAKSDFERAAKLYEQGTFSRQEFDLAEQKERTTAEELKAAQFALQIAQYELELAESALLRTAPASSTSAHSETWRFNIVSPISGRVLRVFQESAGVTATGTRLVELGDPHDLEAEIDVLSSDAVKIKPGARVLFEHWGGDYPLTGRVRIIEPAAFTKISALGVEEQRVYVIADFVDPPEKRGQLGDAFRVEARVVIWEAANVLKVPTGALFRNGPEWSVFAVVQGKARSTAVRIGERNDQEAEVLEGISAGDIVIMHPSDKVRNGVSIRSDQRPS